MTLGGRIYTPSGIELIKEAKQRKRHHTGKYFLPGFSEKFRVVIA
jgi:hypothetical protein